MGWALRAVLRYPPWLTSGSDRYAADSLMIRQLLAGRTEGSRARLIGVAGSVGRNVAGLRLTILALFFGYRDSGKLVQRSTDGLRHLFGTRFGPRVHAAGGMTRAVIRRS